MNQSQDIFKIFEGVKIDPSWAFADKGIKDTTYITHGYHRYPAKFIPQVASRLIGKYTQEGDLVGDPFGGCGTTLVESKVMRRPSIGVDINPVAIMMTKAKITPLEPLLISESFARLKESMQTFDEKCHAKAPQHERIDYWFKEEEKIRLAFLFAEIAKLKDKDIKNFLYCGFSNILKNCSIWNQKSNKPIRDFSKIPSNPFIVFSRQMKKMMNGNQVFFDTLCQNDSLKTRCNVYREDARAIPAKPNSTSLIVTSPPYVTSYEYADLHQLTTFWFEYAENISDFRRSFIGTSHHDKKEIFMNSEIAENIKSRLAQKHNKTAIEVATYFSDMNQVFEKMKRILKKDGKICVVIGNTTLKWEQISNAEVFTQQMLNLGFAVEDIIKREIPSKNLPSTRDKATGKFAKASSDNKVFAYPTEYILVMRKK